METEVLSSLKTDVLRGLSAKQKFLPSKYFYDEKGSELFTQITQLPEYYLTNCELEIFQNQGTDIVDTFFNGDKFINLIELGSGDGEKTKVLLNQSVHKHNSVCYLPVDISEEPTIKLVEELKQDFPNLKVKEQIGDYFDIVNKLNNSSTLKKVILFLGSNIGNYSYNESILFLEKLNKIMHCGDMLFIGFDLIKDPSIIRRAYNDSSGVTREFNLNLLKRLNMELDADFEIKNFEQLPKYNPKTGEATSYIRSKKRQKIYIPELDTSFHFDEGETIFTEISQKYSMPTVYQMAEETGFKVKKNFFDSKNYYTNSLWVKP